MRVKTSTSKNGSISYSIITDITSISGKRTTKIVKTLGNREDIAKAHPGIDPLEWAKQYAAKLKEEKLREANDSSIIEKFDSEKLIDKHDVYKLNSGYLFLKDIYYALSIDKWCKNISKKYKYEFDLNKLLSIMTYMKIISPGSKTSDYFNSLNLLEKQYSKVSHNHFYKALDVLAENADSLEEHLYNASLNVVDRNTKILYYDCTNFFFEIDEASGYKQYGKSKENRPNPIIQMGLFMDASGLPLAFTLFKGNENEQTTLKPLEKRIIKDFNLSEFVVCTDAGLSSAANRKFNNMGKRSFVTTQSIKKLKKHLKEWALDYNGWKQVGSDEEINLCNVVLEGNNSIYYKERWINENGLEQKLFITFSPKHKLYQMNIRNKQVERALSKMTKPSSLKRKNQNDPARFIQETQTTKDGEVAEEITYTLNQLAIDEEAKYDGFYGICTNLEAIAQEIIKINTRKWEIEETFRLMKSEMKSRPVFLQKDNRIEAHFTVCFLSLLIFRILEKRLDNEYTYCQIINKLRDMEMIKHNEGLGYKPAYVRDDLTDALHKEFGFRTDTQIVTKEKLKNILKNIKSGNSTQKQK